MTKPFAYLLTWTTYGTWLPGDSRGWVERGKPLIQPPDAKRRSAAKRRMKTPAVILGSAQRNLVDATIRRHCGIRTWRLYALNVRSNHVHLVVTAPLAPETVMAQLKAWCSRRLTEHQRSLQARSASEGNLEQTQHPASSSRNGQIRWWTEHGSTKWINDEQYLRNAIRYVLEQQ